MQARGESPGSSSVAVIMDGLLEQNRRMRDVFEQEISLQYQYKESRGTHNWYYWNRSLADVLEFFGFLVKTDIYN